MLPGRTAAAHGHNRASSTESYDDMNLEDWKGAIADEEDQANQASLFNDWLEGSMGGEGASYGAFKRNTKKWSLRHSSVADMEAGKNYVDEASHSITGPLDLADDSHARLQDGEAVEDSQKRHTRRQSSIAVIKNELQTIAQIATELVKGEAAVTKKMEMDEETRELKKAREEYEEDVTRRVQALIRRTLVRKEYHHVRRDKMISFNRAKLIRRLNELPDARTSYCLLFFYMIFFAVVMTYFRTSVSSDARYASGGFMKDTIMTEWWQAGDDGYEVRTVGDLYTFIDVGRGYGFIIRKLMHPKSAILQQFESRSITRQDGTEDSEVFMWKQGQGLNGVVIAQIRGNEEYCSDRYTLTQGTDYSANVCQMSIANGGINTEAFGNLTHRDFNDYFNGKNMDAKFSTSAPCPSFSFDTGGASGKWGESHAIIFPYEKGDNEFITYFSDALALVERCEFLDHRTRYLTIEVMLFFGNEIPLVAILWITYEFSIYGQVIPSYELFIVDILPATWGMWTCVMIMFFSCMFMAASYVCMLLYSCLERGIGRTISEYLRNYWTLFDLIFIIIIFFFCSYFWAIESVLSQQSADRNEYSKEFRNNIVSISDLWSTFRTVRAITGAMSFLKILEYTRHRGMLSILTQTLYKAAMRISHFLLTLLLFGAAFLVLSEEWFGDRLLNYSTFGRASMTLLRMTFGDFEYEELRLAAPTTSALFFWGFLIIMGLVLTNFFIAIILDTYSQVMSARRMNENIVEEAHRQFMNSYHAFTSHTIPAQELAAILTWDRQLSRKRFVTLFDIRSRCGRNKLSGECQLILYEYHEQPSVPFVKRVIAPAYRYYKIKTFTTYRPPLPNFLRGTWIIYVRVKFTLLYFVFTAAERVEMVEKVIERHGKRSAILGFLLKLVNLKKKCLKKICPCFHKDADQGDLRSQNRRRFRKGKKEEVPKAVGRRLESHASSIELLPRTLTMDNNSLKYNAATFVHKIKPELNRSMPPVLEEITAVESDEIDITGENSLKKPRWKKRPTDSTISSVDDAVVELIRKGATSPRRKHRPTGSLGSLASVLSSHGDDSPLRKVTEESVIVVDDLNTDLLPDEGDAPGVTISDLASEEN